MNIERFINGLESEFYAWGSLTGYPRDPLRYIKVLDSLQGMTTPSTMHMINFAVQCLDAGEVYLEAGTWRGATFIGALLGNDAQGYAIDNDTMNEHDRDDTRLSSVVWRENVERWGVGDRAHYIDGTIPEVWTRKNLTGGKKVGAYLFDGDKATPDAAYEGLKGVVPYLARQALILVDDANTPQIRQAVYMFCHYHADKAVKLHDMPTPMNCWPSFWNGIMTIGWGVALHVGEEK